MTFLLLLTLSTETTTILMQLEQLLILFKPLPMTPVLLKLQLLTWIT